MTNGIFGTFKTNNETEVSGRWFEFPANADKTIPRVKLARMSANNPRYQAGLEALSKELGRDIELEILTEERAKPHFMKLFIDTILVSWEHIQDAEGVEIEFNKSNAVRLFTEVPDFYQVLISEAKKLNNYRDEAVAKVSE